MKEKNKKLAEAILNKLMKGGRVTGMKFVTPQILLSSPDYPGQDVYINLFTGGRLFNTRPEKFPEKFPDFSTEQIELKIIHPVRDEIIHYIELLAPWPHLIIYFVSGKVLYLNGKHLLYETWEAGLRNWPDSREFWKVIAMPGGSLAIWAPENFSPDITM